MRFDINDGVISGIQFVGGCPGNLTGISLLAEGKPALEVAKLLKGVKCGQKKSSCPAELSKAIYKVLKEEKEALKTAKPPTKTPSAKTSSTKTPAPKAPKAAAVKTPKASSGPKAKAKSPKAR
jgi:uncharacterized protein (TIGR03905 family)